MSIDRPREPATVPGAVTGSSVAEAQLAALTVRLQVQRFEVEMTREGMRVRNEDTAGCRPDDPVPSDLITCRPYDRDGGHLWFFGSDGEPLAEADRVTDAIVRIKSRLARRDPIPMEWGL
ncbi:hypothetical protein [Actinomadura rifamycini]|uniref:hypothetical protein n=1 Tax=Actinomadura rifamycini TaxID=31962 RepID=UPI0003F6C0F5|nr:hypothetical protein [Actinomadura rifamycini]